MHWIDLLEFVLASYVTGVVLMFFAMPLFHITVTGEGADQMEQVKEKFKGRPEQFETIVRIVMSLWWPKIIWVYVTKKLKD